MKKTMAVLCALLLICFAVTASADLYRPETPELLRTLIGGKTFTAAVTGLESTGEDEDTTFTVSVTVCERDRFDAAVIDKLAAGDILVFGNGTGAMITEAAADEFGVTAADGEGSVYSFSKTEDGSYIVSTDGDFPFYTEIFTVKVSLPKDIRFLDWSDPENHDGPVELGFDELLDHLLEGTDFAPYNTQVTFDENGKLVEFLYNYSPWN